MNRNKQQQQVIKFCVNFPSSNARGNGVRGAQGLGLVICSNPTSSQEPHMKEPVLAAGLPEGRIKSLCRSASISKDLGCSPASH